MENIKIDHNLIETMKSITKLSEELIKIIESDDYTNLDSILIKRQQEIDALQNLGCTKEEYRNAENKFEINSLQKIILKLMEDKKIELKEKLYELSKNKIVTNSYIHNNLVGAKIFSKKI